MSYKQLAKERKSIRSKINENRNELDSLKAQKEELMESLEEVEQQRVNAKAAVKVGSGS